MGVWAASHILQDLRLPITQTTAINGTPIPVDDEKGIPTAIFRGTLENLTETTLQKFRRRMCGSKETLAHFMDHAPQRSIDDLRQELLRIGEQAEQYPTPTFNWNKIYIGLQDKIFLPANQQKAWTGKEIHLVESGHYPHTLWNKLFNNTPHE